MHFRSQNRERASAVTTVFKVSAGIKGRIFLIIFSIPQNVDVSLLTWFPNVSLSSNTTPKLFTFFYRFRAISHFTRSPSRGPERGVSTQKKNLSFLAVQF